MKLITTRLFVLLLGVLFSGISVLSAQELKSITVIGTVLDETGFPVIGATVLEKGAPNNGTITDLMGKFTIQVKSNSSLTISYIGYKDQEIAVAGKDMLKIIMSEDVNLMDEVVVVGYGNMKRSDLTGATVSIGSEDIQSTNAQSLSQALQGMASGVQVSTTSAAPGGSSSIRIRGVNSLLSDAEPLYVVDGFPIDNSEVNNLNLSDVKSVEILKDASSTSIYGSRGANGVILIQTNSGQISKPKFNFSASFGVQDVYREVDLLNGDEFAYAFNEYQPGYYDGSHITRPKAGTIGEGTNWFNEIMQTGYVQNYNLSASGGTDDIKYRASLGYYNNQGVILGGEFERFNFSLMNDIRLTKWLNLKTNIFLTRTDTDSSGDRTGLQGDDGTMNNAIKMSPTINVFDEYGNYNANTFPGAQSEENPVAVATENLNNMLQDNISANATFVVSPFAGFEFQAKVGANIQHMNALGHNSTKTIMGAKLGGEASLRNTKRQFYINEYIANYKREMGKHSLYLTGAFSLESTTFEMSGISGSGLVSDDLSYAGIASATNVDQPIFTKTYGSMMSALGRVNYSYDDRYMITVTNRTDGNSRFSAGNKWGNFPSVAAAWRVTEEDFMKPIDNVLSNLKLRLSWGITGNSKIGTNYALTLLTDAMYPSGETNTGGVGPSTLGNPDLTWETTEMYNIGLDFSFWKNRIHLSAEAYYKYTSDMLMSYDIPVNTGYQKAYINAGELSNKGLEFTLNANVIKTKDWSWQVGANISLNRDRVEKLYGDGPLIVDLGDNQQMWITEGGPIRQFVGMQVHEDPIFDSQEDINNYVNANGELLQPNAKPGDIRYVDTDGNGKVSEQDDKIVYGSAFPKFTYGISTKVNWKGLSLDVFMNGSEGNWIQNRTLAYLRNTKTMRNNLSAEFADRWTTTNTDGTVPRIGADPLPAFEDASFFRIQNISLSYSFPKRLIKGIDGLTLTAAIDNVYVFTGYSGWDPEVNSATGNQNVNVGQDTNSYPKPRTYRVALNFNF